MQREFRLTDKELESAEQFSNEHKHKKKYRNYGRNIGGDVTITFTPTSVGTGVRVTCGLCGKSKDITDFDSW